MRALDLTGNRFGRLVAIQRGEPHISPSRTQVTWVCRCDCGSMVTVQRGALRGGLTTSCGCALKDELTSRRGGKWNFPAEYDAWIKIRQRCQNIKNKDWKNYGGRGIRVCQRWEKSFSSFLSDMGRRPSSGHSIDRIDVDGNYEPTNCRWATTAEQAWNRRNNRVIEFKGRTMVLSDWAKEIGIAPSSLHGRLQRHKVDIALTAPKGMK